MWYILCFIGLFVTIIWPLIKLIVSLFSKKSNKTVDRLLDFATLMTKHIQNNLKIDSFLIFYEQIYLLYFLRDMYAIGQKVPEASRHAILNDLIIILDKNHKLDFLKNKDDFKNTFSKRYENYMYILLQDNYNFSDNFFNDVIEYQCLLIATIETKDTFSDIKAASLECTDYEYGIEGDCVYKTKNRHNEIKNILMDNLQFINTFMSQQ